jgi:hypothetical protein
MKQVGKKEEWGKDENRLAGRVKIAGIDNVLHLFSRIL